jgi:TRAP-type C4-dicarboxylate transport system substrate-binding protein
MSRVVRFIVLIAALSALAPTADAVELKIATVAPDGSYWMNEARDAAAEIAERTSGRVTFRFYPGGTMGTETAVLRKMRIGQLHGGFILAGTFSHVAPNLQIYNLPLLFHSYDEVDAIRSVVDGELIAELAEGGYHTFGFIEGGFAYLYATKKAATFAELKGRKAWIPEDDLIGKVLVEESGLSPVPLALADVLTGLQTGLLDVVSGPPVAAVALQWFTKVKYIIDQPVIYTYGCMVISDRAWSRLSDEDREIADEVLGRMTRNLDQRAREDNQSARQALQKQGMVEITPEEETSRQWEGVARRSLERLVQELGLDQAMVSRIENQLTALRATGADDSR